MLSFFWFRNRISEHDRQLQWQDAQIKYLLQRVRQLMIDFTQLSADVAKNGDLIASAQQTITGLAKALADAIAQVQAANPAADLAAVQTLQSSLEANNANLANAIVAGTTSAPAPAPAA